MPKKASFKQLKQKALQLESKNYYPFVRKDSRLKSNPLVKDLFYKLYEHNPRFSLSWYKKFITWCKKESERRHFAYVESIRNNPFIKVTRRENLFKRTYGENWKAAMALADLNKEIKNAKNKKNQKPIN